MGSPGKLVSPFILNFARQPRAIKLVAAPVSRIYDEEEFAAALSKSYEEGFQEATRISMEKHGSQQEEILELQHQTLRALALEHNTLVAHFSELLPVLVMKAIGRVLAVVEIDKAMITGIVSELLVEIHPGKGELEVSLNAGDLNLFEGNEMMFRQKYPEISFVPDADLRSGDCVVRSRFGTFDGRVATKVENVESLLQ